MIYILRAFIMAGIYDAFDPFIYGSGVFVVTVYELLNTLLKLP